MSELPYMPILVNDEIAESSDMTNEELGALVRIKWALWKAGGYLTDDGKQLARVSRAGSRWGRIAPAVLARLTIAAGKVSSPSVLATLLITRERRAKSVKAGEAKWRKPEGLLKSSNPLKNNEPTTVQASPKHMLGPSNQNKNYREEEDSLPASSAAAGLGKERAQSVDGDRDQMDRTIHDFGTALLVLRVGVTRLQARRQLATWLGETGPEPLAAILAETEKFGLRGPHFVTAVDARVKAIAAERLFGKPLPLGPVRIRGRGGG